MNCWLHRIEEESRRDPGRSTCWSSSSIQSNPGSLRSWGKRLRAERWRGVTGPYAETFLCRSAPGNVTRQIRRRLIVATEAERYLQCSMCSTFLFLPYPLEHSRTGAHAIHTLDAQGAGLACRAVSVLNMDITQNMLRACRCLDQSQQG